MNKYLGFFLFAFIFSNPLFGQNKIMERNRFTITGRLEGRSDGLLILKYRNSENKLILDTTNVKKGSFFISGTIKYPTYAVIESEINSLYFENPNRGIFYLEPNAMSMHLIEGKYSSGTLTGSKTHTQYELLELKRRSFYETSKSIALRQDFLRNQVQTPAVVGELDSLQRALLKEKMLAKRVEVMYIKRHPNSFLTADLIAGRYLNFSDLSSAVIREIYKKSSIAIKNSVNGKKIRDALSAVGNASVNNKVPNLNGKDIDGEEISLTKEFANNYVLLDFWGSWCGPCRELAPLLKSLHLKYSNNGLEILSISNDTNKESWKKAVREDGTGQWRHVLMSDVEDNDIDAVNLRFDVRIYPTFLLVDRTGKILYRINGSIDNQNLKEIEDLISNSKP